MTPRVALSIAGSDSGGGAGIQADLRTFTALGLHGCTAVAALTAQNTTEVRDVLATPAGFLRSQIEAVLDDFEVAAVKTGMLATAENIEVVAQLAADDRLPNLVVDPVLVSSSGHRLLDPDAESAYTELLLRHAHVTTPNCREAAVLVGREVSDFDDQVEVAHGLAERTGARWVVVTGGDAPGSTESIDVAVGRGTLIELTAERITSSNVHGTGCSFASAVAGYLALGEVAPDAMRHAKDFVTGAIQGAVDWKLGAGYGPIDHLGWERSGVRR